MRSIVRPSPPTQRERSSPVRVLLISQLPLIRASLRFVLEDAGFNLVGEAGPCVEALVTATALRPDIIILDLDLGAASIDEVSALAGLAAKFRIIALATRRSPQTHQTALAVGASGLISKNEPSDVLVKAVWKVSAGEAWLDSGHTAHGLREVRRARRTNPDDSETAKIATLTAREREIIARLGEGLKNKAIAQRLSISEATVRHHLTSILDKLDVSNRFELVVYAFRHRLVN